MQYLRIIFGAVVLIQYIRLYISLTMFESQNIVSN